MASQNSNKKQSAYKKNPLEQNNDSFFDQFFGDTAESDYSPLERPFTPPWEKKAQKKPALRKEFTVFNQVDDREKRLIPMEVQKLTEEIRREIAFLKKQNKALVTQVADIEKTTLQSIPEKAGLYHVRFLEIILSFLKTLQAKVGEARTWMTALQSKKKKKGSLFAARAKKKGTQYSLSQELQTARSVQ